MFPISQETDEPKMFRTRTRLQRKLKKNLRKN
jgi:hypothetical protein